MYPMMPPVKVPEEVKVLAKTLKIKAKRPNPLRLEIDVEVKEDAIESAYTEFAKIMKKKGKNVTREKFEEIVRNTATKIMIDTIRDAIFFTTNTIGLEVEYEQYEGEFGGQ